MGSMATVGPSGEVTSLFIVDLDDLTASRVRAAVLSTELAVEAVSPGEILERLVRAPRPVIVLLDWSAERVEERRWLCAAMRRAAGPGRCHVIAVGGATDQAALLDAADGPADDALVRPFDDETLLLALRRARRATRDHAGVCPARQALEEALQNPHGGEVAIRSGDVTALIHVHDAHIVWAHVSSAPTRLEDVLAHGGHTLDPEMVAAVKEESRANGKHFLDVLVSWGLLSEEAARESVRRFVAERVQMALELPAASAMFLPRVRAQGGRVRFRASDIPCLTPSAPAQHVAEDEPPPFSALRPLPLSRDAMNGLVGLALQIEGVEGAAVFDRQSGACLCFAGDHIDSAVTWSQLRTCRALGPTAGDVLATTSDRCFVARPLAHAPSLVLCVALSLSGMTVGFARAAIATLTEKTPDRETGDAGWRAVC